MGIKDAFDNVVDNVKDAVHEGTHRSEAEGEQTKRDVAGDTMTPAENAGSLLNQAKSTVQADIDATKQDVRNS